MKLSSYVEDEIEFTNDGFGSFGGLVFEKMKVSEADVTIVGIPYESATSGNKGTSLAPSYLRLISKDMQTVSRGGIDINDMVIADVGNIPVYPVEGIRTRESVENYYSHLLSKTKNPIIAMGGDHSLTFPILKSIAKNQKVAIIWFDAHRDLLNELLGSNYSHGSPLRRALELENINPQNILLVGTRYMEPNEQKYVKENNITELRMVELEESNFDIFEFQNLVKKIVDGTDFLYVSIDIDVIDPAFAPGTGTPVSGGMTTSQLMNYIQAIPVKVNAFDIMEISPPQDYANITLKAAMGLITEIIALVS